MLFTVIIIIAIIAAILLGLIVLVQNPKGGGLSGTFGGAANQIFGYKRTTDDIERITWGLVVIVFALCLSSAAFKPTQTVETQNGLRPEAVPPTNSINMPTQPTEDEAAPVVGDDPADGGVVDPQ